MIRDCIVQIAAGSFADNFILYGLTKDGGLYRLTDNDVWEFVTESPERDEE